LLAAREGRGRAGAACHVDGVLPVGVWHGGVSGQALGSLASSRRISTVTQSSSGDRGVAAWRGGRGVPCARLRPRWRTQNDCGASAPAAE